MSSQRMFIAPITPTGEEVGDGQGYQMGNLYGPFYDFEVPKAENQISKGKPMRFLLLEGAIVDFDPAIFDEL